MIGISFFKRYSNQKPYTRSILWELPQKKPSSAASRIFSVSVPVSWCGAGGGKSRPMTSRQTKRKKAEKSLKKLKKKAHCCAFFLPIIITIIYYLYFYLLFLLFLFHLFFQNYSIFL